MRLYYFTPKIEAARFSEMLVTIYQTSLRHIPENNLSSHRHEDLKSDIGTVFPYTGLGPIYTYIYLAIWYRADIKKSKLEKIWQVSKGDSFREENDISVNKRRILDGYK
jgi:hypothetical protein